MINIFQKKIILLKEDPFEDIPCVDEFIRQYFRNSDYYLDDFFILFLLENGHQPTSDHCLTTSLVARLIWDTAVLSPEFCTQHQFIQQYDINEIGLLVSMAGKLHDLGKIFIKPNILYKKYLTEEESLIIKKHVKLGSLIFEAITTQKKPFEELHSITNELINKTISMSINSHHERPDGTGYSEGKKIKIVDLPTLVTCLVSISDFFEAITSISRTYREKPMPENIIKEIKAFAGKQWPEILAHLLLDSVQTKKDEYLNHLLTIKPISPAK